MDYKLEKILNRVTELADNLEIVRGEITQLQKEAASIKQTIKDLLKEIY